MKLQEAKCDCEYDRPAQRAAELEEKLFAAMERIAELEEEDARLREENRRLREENARLQRQLATGPVVRTDLDCDGQLRAAGSSGL